MKNADTACVQHSLQQTKMLVEELKILVFRFSLYTHHVFKGARSGRVFDSEKKINILLPPLDKILVHPGLKINLDLVAFHSMLNNL